MDAVETQLEILIDEAGGDAEEVDRLTAYVQRDLRELGASSVERAAGEAAPEFAKGDPFTLGALALVAAPVLLPKILEFLQAIVLRGEQRRVRIKTPAGLEVEFTPEKRLTAAEVTSLARKLSQPGS